MKRKRRNLETQLENILTLDGLIKSTKLSERFLSKLKYLKLNFEIKAILPYQDGEYYIGYLKTKSNNHLLIKKTYDPPNITDEIELQEFLPTSKWSERVLGRFEAAYKLLDSIENILLKKGIKYDK